MTRAEVSPADSCRCKTASACAGLDEVHGRRRKRRPWFITLSDLSHLYSTITGLPSSSSPSVSIRPPCFTRVELSVNETSAEEYLKIGFEEALEISFVRERPGSELFYRAIGRPEDGHQSSSGAPMHGY